MKAMIRTQARGFTGLDVTSADDSSSLVVVDRFVLKLPPSSSTVPRCDDRH